MTLGVMAQADACATMKRDKILSWEKNYCPLLPPIAASGPSL
jgi:hypothetical protein